MSLLAFTPLALGIAGAAMPLVIFRLRKLALAQRHTADRQPTEAERALLRRRGRLSVVMFVVFWVVSGGLVAAVTLLPAPRDIQRAVFALIVLMAAGGIAFQFRTFCPVCGYRLGYQTSLGVPARCERCGADL